MRGSLISHLCLVSQACPTQAISSEWKLIENYKSEVFVFSIVIASTATSKKYITLPNKSLCLPFPELITHVCLCCTISLGSRRRCHGIQSFSVDPGTGKHCVASGTFHSRAKFVPISGNTQPCLVNLSLSHTQDQECDGVHVCVRAKSNRDLVLGGLQGRH